MKVSNAELQKERKKLRERNAQLEEELRIERAKNANSIFERTTSQIDNVLKLENANVALSNEIQNLKQKLNLEIQKNEKLTLG